MASDPERRSCQEQEALVSSFEQRAIERDLRNALLSDRLAAEEERSPVSVTMRFTSISTLTLPHFLSHPLTSSSGPLMVTFFWFLSDRFEADALAVPENRLRR